MQERRSAPDAQPLFVDFVNTLHWYEGVPIELIGDLPGANAWLAENGMPSLPNDAALARLLAFRERARAVTEAVATGQSLDALDLAALNDALANASGHLVVLEPTSAEPRLALEADAAVDALVAFRVALSLANFLESGDRQRLKLCANPGCGFAFVDTSMNATRRWCFMRYCGNRVKVRAFRTRQRTAD